MRTNAPGYPQRRLFLVTILAWAVLATLNSCAMFRTDPPHRVHMPLEIPDQFETATEEENPLKTPEEPTDVKPGETSQNALSELGEATKPDAIVASLMPPTKKLAPAMSAMYPGAPPSHKYSSHAPDLFFDDMDRESLKKVIANQLKAMRGKSRRNKHRLGNVIVTTADLIETLERFSKLLDQNLSLKEFSRQIRKKFIIYSAGRGKSKRTLFTGYYTPLVEASRVKTKEYIYPLYNMPIDLPDSRLAYRQASVLGVGRNGFGMRALQRKMLTRKEIDGLNLLRNKNLEVAWLKDDLERFFLHIQGSGILQYADGVQEGVQYAGSNRYPYKSVGKLMIRDRAITVAQGSMQGIKKYFKDNPHHIEKYLYQNKRYIFFSPTDRLPTGSGGGELVAGRSIATDKSLYPAGGLGFVMAKKPILDANFKIVGWKNFVRFVLDQDTGSAIRGRGRADLYFGVGEEAGAAAGHYMQRGKLFYLVRK